LFLFSDIDDLTIHNRNYTEKTILKYLGVRKAAINMFEVDLDKP